MTDDANFDHVWLKEELDRPGRSQSALARHMGLNPSSVNRIVNGKRELKARELAEVREYLRATVTPLAETSADKARPSRESTGLGLVAEKLFKPLQVGEGRTLDHMKMVYQAVSEEDDPLLAQMVYQIISDELTSFIRSSLPRSQSSLKPDDIEFLETLPETAFSFDIKITLATGMGLLRKIDRDQLQAIADLNEAATRQAFQTLDDPSLADIWRRLLPVTYASGRHSNDKLRLHLMLTLSMFQSLFLDGLDATREKIGTLEAHLGKLTT